MQRVADVVRFIGRSSKRMAVLVVGLALLALGLVVLGTEFAWARHLLEKAREQASRAGQAGQQIPGVARATAAAKRAWPFSRRPATAEPEAIASADSPTP
jgi:hypothetical protein